MNLINEGITHKVFGEGQIVDQDASFVTIDFTEDTKKFVYPDAFQEFITLNDQNTANTFKEVISKNEMREAALEEEREKENERQELERQRLDMLKNLKIHESSQIVFRLDEEEQHNAFTNWEVSTGVVQSGKNKGQPNRVARLSPNSACVLTTRESDQQETDRIIHGLYMVNETFSGNLTEDGMVPSHATFRIELSEEEADKMLFWNYYINKNHPHRTTWNSGKFRYFDNIWTAQILKDIIVLRTEDEQITEAKNFLEYFCQMNALDIDNIPETNGALMQ